MNIEEYTPTELLQPFIKTYRIIESGDELLNRVVPNTSFAIAFRLKGQISYVSDTHKTTLPSTTFSGLRKSVRLIHYASKTAAFIVLFTETGVSAFFKQPLHELFEESVSLDRFFLQSEIAVLEERLTETESNTTRVAIIEQFFYSKIIYNKPDRLVSDAIAKIYSHNGMIKISELAGSLFISQDAFEKRFRKVTGATPKQFSSIVKMNTIIQQKSAGPSFLDLALENGYYDQAHFNKDFKLFTGQKPTDFFKSASYW
jgi:AraC-like DNA-binding protein